jgi:hypothetical protein
MHLRGMLESREREEREREKEMRSRSARSWRAGFGGGRGYFAQEGGDLYRRITGLWKNYYINTTLYNFVSEC